MPRGSPPASTTGTGARPRTGRRSASAATRTTAARARPSRTRRTSERSPRAAGTTHRDSATTRRTSCPVDLNAHLYRYERDLAAFARRLGREPEARAWDRCARERRALIDRWLWDEAAGLYRDLSLSRRAPLERVPRSLALYVPLWAGAATPAQAALCRAQLPVFECSHGLASCEPGWFDGSEHNHPIGWAYSHWFAVEGLRRYGYAGDAERVARKWVGLVALRHAATGSFFERYDVVDPERAVAGRYETQTGFGWTNGVFLALSLLSIGAGGRSAPARP